MAPRTEDELATAWRALSGGEDRDGWRIVSIEPAGDCSLHAARQFPGDEEALVVTFPVGKVPADSQLPGGRGFEVRRLEFPFARHAQQSVVLARLPAGSLELFSMMAQDCISVLRKSELRGRGLIDLFLQRVAAWQEFMQREGDGLLSNEAETGLVGELFVISELLAAKLQPAYVVDAWEGPIDGIQDFALGRGALEVKASVATSGFPAKIGSLEQLDDSVRQPIFLAAVRFALQGNGQRLPEFVEGLRGALEGTGASGVFEARLARAGYQNVHASEYTRVFSPVQQRLFKVDDGFPRLFSGNVSAVVRRARYELDLDLTDCETVEMNEMLDELGLN